MQAAEFLQNGSQVFWLDINYQFNILRLASTLNTAIGGANFSSSQLEPNSSLRSQLKSQIESFDQSRDNSAEGTVRKGTFYLDKSCFPD